jgi:hypothetical protein
VAGSQFLITAPRPQTGSNCNHTSPHLFSRPQFGRKTVGERVARRWQSEKAVDQTISDKSIADPSAIELMSGADKATGYERVRTAIKSPDAHANLVVTKPRRASRPGTSAATFDEWPSGQAGCGSRSSTNRNATEAVIVQG